MTVTGEVAFPSQLMRSTLVETDANFFELNPYGSSLGSGSATIAFQPIGLDGAIEVSRLRLWMSSGGIDPPRTAPRTAIEPISDPLPYCEEPEIATDCQPPFLDSIPDVDVLDRTTGEWQRLPRFEFDQAYELASPERYVDPTSGEARVRYTSLPNIESYFPPGVEIEGTVR
jgi:hypothetical protein